jgi:hypothetical protein
MTYSANACWVLWHMQLDRANRKATSRANACNSKNTLNLTTAEHSLFHAGAHQHFYLLFLLVIPLQQQGPILSASGHA